MKNTDEEKRGDLRAKKAIAQIELQKIKRQKKSFKAPDSGSMSMGAKIAVTVSIV